MGKSCKDVAESLVQCLKKSKCVMEGGDMRSCMKGTASADECSEHRTAYLLCKRGSLDMRTRIQGPKY